HLSYNWHDAKWMFDRATQLGAPFMAGSSLPFGYRNPWLEHPLETPITEAVSIGYSGLDIYGFHTLETLQCMVERRVGGETGVAAVTCLEGDAVWEAGRAGAWWRELAEAACAPIENKPSGAMEDHCENPALFLLEYQDGFRGAALMLNGYVTDLAYAGRVGGEIYGSEFYLHGDPHPHFSYLSLNIEEMFVTGVPTYPVERTLLTSGVLEAALDSRHQGYIRLETPHLDIGYRSYDSIPWRPTGPRPVGASLQPLPE
ncbi:hypothetical protein F4X33_13280, partial [Candidatus Poribacteria bacterium]|nr:hypothetical protein [Candidatus Poribacteria bacterium]